MKSVIFALAFVLIGSFAFANENSSVEFSSDCCVCDAWDFGTQYGQGDARLEYLMTDAYYDHFC